MMKHKTIGLAFLLVAGTMLTGCDDQLSTADLVHKVKDGTVLIGNQVDATTNGLGTGFIIDKNTIITNNHVIAGDGTVTVYSPETRKKFAAKVEFADPIADIAIVQLNDWDTFKKEETPKILTLGNSNETREGDKIVVIGHPWGLTWSVSQGIISSKNRREGAGPKFLDQIDAKLFEGNSGGPVFNARGEVVCVSELMLEGKGGSYGFCIPSNLVKKVLSDFEKFKEVRWRIMNVSLKLTDDGSSVILDTIQPNGAADKAGLKSGDKVIKVYTPKNQIEGKKIETPDDLVTVFAGLYG